MRRGDLVASLHFPLVVVRCSNRHSLVECGFDLQSQRFSVGMRYPQHARPKPNPLQPLYQSKAILLHESEMHFRSSLIHSCRSCWYGSLRVDISRSNKHDKYVQ